MVLELPEDNDKEFWSKWHQRRLDRDEISSPNDLAIRLGRTLGHRRSRVLDLGSGDGIDSVYLASFGHEVIGLDISDIATKRARAVSAKSPHGDRVEFHSFDISDPLSFADNSFDVIYSHLGLHYFDGKSTRKLFDEIHRICRPAGLLFAAVKSTRDPLYAKGTALDHDMYYYNGHRRHFFSEGYARKVLEAWNVTEVSGYSDYYGSSGPSNQFLRLIAQKKCTN